MKSKVAPMSAPGWRPAAPARACCLTVAATDMTCSERVRDLFERCQRVLEEGGVHIVIDLKAVTIADTKIVACLVALYQLARGTSARLEVCGSPSVCEIASICRLDRLMHELNPEAKQLLRAA